jgi:hypothetical protein
MYKDSIKHFWNMESQDFEFWICLSKVEQLMNDHFKVEFATRFGRRAPFFMVSKE